MYIAHSAIPCDFNMHDCLILVIGFFGCDSVVFMKALQALEKQNKCIIIEGDTSEEDGVKFT